MPFATLMSIKVEGEEILTDYGARDMTADLEFVQQAESFERSWNGGLIDMGMPQFRKLQLIITCTDFESNGLARIPPGTEVTVICLPQLGVNDNEGSVNQLTLTMWTGRWRESRQEWAARTTWTLPLYEK